MNNIQEICFKNLIITFDWDKVNKKMCKRKERTMFLWTLFVSILLYPLFLMGAGIVQSFKVKALFALCILLLLGIYLGLMISSMY